MKILTITYALGIGGVARTAQIFAEGYQSLGMDSRVLATTDGGPREAELRAGDIPLWMGLTPEIYQEILDWNPDVIHIHSHSFGDKELAFLNPLFEGRMVVEKNIFSRPVPWTHRMDYSYQLSTWCAWNFCNAAPHLIHKAAIVPNGANNTAFKKSSPEEALAFRKQHNIPQQALVIGRIGQLYHTKWSPVLIEAFNRLSKKYDPLHLILVNPSKPVRKQAAASPFVKKIVLIDNILGDKNLSIAYSAMDLFALAADQGESFGNVLAEAMLCEIPIVALSTPWQDNSQCEVVGHEQGGLIALTPTGFRKAIDALLNDPNLRDTLGKAGRKKVIQNYSRRTVAQISLDTLQGKQAPLNKKTLDQEILRIYRNAFDRPSPLTLWLLKDARFMRLTRYTTHYHPIMQLPFEILKIVFSKLSRTAKPTPQSAPS